MIITLTNKQISAKICTIGAELRSLTDSTNNEYIWQADENIWGSSAPILFPITGVLRDGTTRIDQKLYEIPKHGLLRGQPFKVVNKTATEVTLSYQSSARTEALYPFQFLFEVTFKLTDHGIKVAYRIQNRSERALPFSIGSHPAFSLPNYPTKTYFIHSQVDVPQASVLVESGLIDTRQLPNPFHNEYLAITATLFDRDALVFLNSDTQSATLFEEHKPLITMQWDPLPHVAFWAKKEAPFVCIEPWMSHSCTPTSTKEFEAKPGIQLLAIDSQYTHSYSVTIH